MLTSVALAAVVLAAPVPRDAKPAGPAPRIVELTPDPDGRVRILVTRTEKRTVTEKFAAQGPNGQVVIQERQREVPVTQQVMAELVDVKDLTVYTADGKEADKALALKRLADGAAVVVSADGQKVDPRYLRLFRDDVLVLTSPELAGPQPQVVPAMPGARPVLRAQIQALPVPVAPPPPPPPPAPKKD
jgi:hypothetical protein